MSLFRFKRRVSFVNAYYHLSPGLSRFSPRVIEAGDVFEEPPAIGLGVYPDDVEQLPDPRDAGPPATLAEVVSGGDALLEWIRAKHVCDPRQIVVARLRQLWEAAAMLPDAPPAPFDAQTISAARTVPELVRLIKLLRQSATEAKSGAPLLPPNEAKVSPENVPAEDVLRAQDKVVRGSAAKQESPPTDGPTMEGMFFAGGVPHRFAPLQWRLLKTLHGKGSVAFEVIGDEVWGDSEWTDGRLRKLVCDTNAKLLGYQLRFEIISPMDAHYLLQELPAVTPQVT